MEQLIILVIMLALGSLFGKKKEKPEPKKQPPVQKPTYTQTVQRDSREPQRSNAAPVNKSRSLKDLSRNLFEDIQKEFKELQQEIQPEEAPVKSQAPQTEIFYPEPALEKKRQERAVKAVSTPRSERQSNARGRFSSDQQEAFQSNDRILQEDLIPTTRQQVLQGIVYSEILGPPKSKR
ncbi:MULTISPECIES: hypothetical protein [Sporosarcina]|uniref:hypothetical protein n=1 Tax=Sporosarcina TaxID=1569 RepID=UPI00129AD8DA|nr:MULTISPECIES: hypothetical protein [Sporosarcina]GKV64650.1 hypothetical protein NCCP2331_08030 [Sporosarcina sp. NCCP-2331]GLB54477.1 hypothetical protein NCCP2378_02620 [Sporosarcina sp. NCCP-2378]